LKQDPDNVKALFRIGQAHLELNNLYKAQEWLGKAREKDPNGMSRVDVPRMWFSVLNIFIFFSYRPHSQGSP
jgi:tetratricopeptide (TPR) repeat protein